MIKKKIVMTLIAGSIFLNSGLFINNTYAETANKNIKPNISDNDEYLKNKDKNDTNKIKENSEIIKQKEIKEEFKIEVKKNQWELKDGIWYYYGEDGKLVKGFRDIGEYKYYFDNDHKMVVGWQNIDGKDYYFRSNGPMRIGWEKFPEGWYYLGEDGVKTTGWKIVDGYWYYFDKHTGIMKTNWEDVDGYRYYFKSSGQMVTGWQQIGSNWYYFRSNGPMRIGWEKINGDWFYFAKDGSMVTGWQKINGDWYYFRSNGTMRIGWEKFPEGWYLFKDNGVMATGWHQLGSTWYHMKDNGLMNTGWQKINGYWYYLNENGAMNTGWKKIDGYWYYFKNNGPMATFWESINGNWYHFTSGGALETNKVVGEWYVNSDGIGSQIVTEGVYGKSGRGRNLDYYRIGNGKKVLLAVFGVHGYEDAWNGDAQELKTIAEKSLARLKDEYSYKGKILSEWSVYLLPSANPDGRIEGWTNYGPGRTTITTKNDINRSFPIGFRPHYTDRNYTGAAPLGSPEAQALYSFINKTMNGATEKVLLDVHGWENKTIGNPSIGKYFDSQFGFNNIDKYPGGFVITYGNSIGAKSVLVELPFPSSHEDIIRRDFSGKFSNALVNILLNN